MGNRDDLKTPEELVKAINESGFIQDYCRPWASGLTRFARRTYATLPSRFPETTEPVGRLLPSAPNLSLEFEILFLWASIQTLAPPMRDWTRRYVMPGYPVVMAGRFVEYETAIGGEERATTVVRSCVAIAQQVALEQQRHRSFFQEIAAANFNHKSDYDRAVEMKPKRAVGEALNGVAVALGSALELPTPSEADCLAVTTPLVIAATWLTAEFFAEKNISPTSA